MKKILLSALMVSTLFAQDASALDLKSALSFSRENVRSSDPWSSQAVIKTDRYVLLSQTNLRQGALILESFDKSKIATEQTAYLGSVQIEPMSQLRVVTISAYSRAHRSKIELCIPKGSSELYMMNDESWKASSAKKEVRRTMVAGKMAIVFDVDKPAGGDFAFFSASSVEVADGADSAAEYACARAVESKATIR